MLIKCHFVVFSILKRSTALLLSYGYFVEYILEEALDATTFTASVNLEAAKDLFADLDMTTLEGKREAVHKFLAVVRSEGINVGPDDNEAKIKIGTLVMSNITLGPEQLLSLAENKYGTVKSSKAKLKMASTGTVCEGNEGYVQSVFLTVKIIFS